MQFELALNAGPSHPVNLDVPAHPKEKNVKAKIASAMNIFNHLLIASTPPFQYKNEGTRTTCTSPRSKFSH